MLQFCNIHVEVGLYNNVVAKYVENILYFENILHEVLQTIMKTILFLDKDDF